MKPVSLALVLIVGLATSSARAEGESRLLIVDASNAPGVEIEALRTAIANETHRRVLFAGEPGATSGAHLVVTTLSDGTLKVRFEGSPLERVVPLEQDASSRTRQIALLAGNLTRSEADELLARPATAAPISNVATRDEKPIVTPKRETPPTKFKVAVTISGFQPAGGFIEIGAEARASRHVGLGGSLGISRLKGFHESSWLFGTSTVDKPYIAIEMGFSPRYYFVGDFDHGLQIGVQAKARIGLREGFLFDSEREIPLSISAGPYVGYKYTAPFGLTLEVQAGIAGAVGSGYPDLASGFGIAKPAKLVSVSTNSHTASAYGALFNANIGWSF